MVRPAHLPVRCAPLERKTVVSGEIYKHLAPTEPEHSAALAIFPLRNIPNYSRSSSQ
jgi:hypothetical protein